MSRLNQITERLGSGQLFNWYAHVPGGWFVSLGPVTNRIDIAIVDSALEATLIVNALRAYFEQPPLLPKDTE